MINLEIDTTITHRKNRSSCGYIRGKTVLNPNTGLLEVYVKNKLYSLFFDIDYKPTILFSNPITNDHWHPYKPSIITKYYTIEYGIPDTWLYLPDNVTILGKLENDKFIATVDSVTKIAKTYMEKYSIPYITKEAHLTVTLYKLKKKYKNLCNES